MGRIESQRGEGNLGCIIWALVVIVVAHVAWIMVPVEIASAQLEDFMVEQARFAEHRSPERIEKAILKKARDLEIPLDPKKVEAYRRGDHIYMKAEYTMTMTFFGGYTYDKQFKHDVDRPIFIF
jgi:hypothetical protein